ncbi:hypothetical protein [Limnovirga soli]|uniref:Uncharacterized protein n=1 Tax=Limnovirga soli TaxID=2656915 RepID=A0A8J8JVQ4_9BACT|nr:hypothetical protein [Limnovirga soli]NNV54516.1 hypothetical protein [Limnovirga soli]
MPIQSDNTLKAWFERLDRPTQAQFWDLIDSKWNKNDLIPIAKIDGLTDILNQLGAVAPSFNSAVDVEKLIPADSVLAMVLIVPQAGTDVTINIGTTNGGAEISEVEILVSYADPQPIVLNRYFKIETTIYITGITSLCKFKLIYK